MLRDHFINRLFRISNEQHGLVNNGMTTDTETQQEEQVRYADQSRGIDADDIGETLLDEMEEVHDNAQTTLHNFSRTLWDIHRAWRDLQPVTQGNGLVYNTNAYTTASFSPLTDVNDRLNKLDRLEKAVAEMITSREHAFKLQSSSSTDAKIVDYGHKLADLFKELYPELYRQAIESVRYLPDSEAVSTDN